MAYGKCDITKREDIDGKAWLPLGRKIVADSDVLAPIDSDIVSFRSH